LAGIAIFYTENIGTHVRNISIFRLVITKSITISVTPLSHIIRERISGAKRWYWPTELGI